MLERGRLGERWRTARWDSFRLLTPAWMTRLPHFRDRRHPPGRVHPGRCVRRAPRAVRHVVRRSSRDRSARARARRHRLTGYRLDTDAGTWRARHVVIATGTTRASADPRRPRPRARAPGQRLPQPRRQLAPGGVLVVGASSSGVQIADELSRSGRDVTLVSRAAHPRATPLPGHGRLLVAPGHRPSRPHHRHDARPGGSPSRAIASARRHLGPAWRTSTSASSSTAGSASSAGSPRPAARPWTSVTTSAPRSRTPTVSCAGCSGRSTTSRSACSGTASCCLLNRSGASRVTRPPRRIDLAAEGIDDRRGRGRLRPRLRLPSRAGPRARRADPPGARPHGGTRPVRRGPALPAPPRLGAHRRRAARRTRRGRPPGPRRDQVTGPACAGSCRR